MSKFINLTQKVKKIAFLVMLSVCAIAFSITGTTLLKGSASTLAEITAPATGFNEVVHYEFRDSRNFGKDSLGNYNLIVGTGVEVYETNGGLSLGGVMYAPKLDTSGTDFSDLIKGSFSLSMRVYMKTGEKTAHRLFATGSYGNSFTANWRYSGFQMIYDNATSADGNLKYYGTNANSALTTGNLFSDTAAWYRITMIYNDTDLSFRMLATKEGDSAYAFDSTQTLPEKAVFGGFAYSFTIGAGSNFGANIQNKVAMSTFTPNISDFRLYSGIIDNAEISSIATYDQTPWKLDELTGDNAGYESVVHYEFKDKTNLGKDSLGNYDLTVGSGVVYDDLNGGVTIGKTGGILYAKDLGDGKDFSDNITGSYTISMRVYIRGVNNGGNYLVSTGSYSSHYRAEWSYSGLKIGMGNSQEAAFGSSNSSIGNTVLFNNEFAWYRITMIYDESTLQFRVISQRENDEYYSYDYSEQLSSVSTFGGSAYSFTIGGQSKFGANVKQYSDGTITGDGIAYPNISDFRLYKGVIDEAELAKIQAYDAENYFTVNYMDGTDVVKTEKVLKTKPTPTYTPEKTGYTFNGWYTNAEFTGETVDTVVYAEKKTLALYAKWTENPLPSPPALEDSSSDTSSDSAETSDSADNSTTSSSEVGLGNTGCNGSVVGAVAFAPIGILATLLACKRKKDENEIVKK